MSANKLISLVQPVVEDLGFEFVGLEYSSNPKNKAVTIYIDYEKGIAIEHCEQVSREVAALLDVEDPIAGQYNLEVSSPGLDRPLFTTEHYQKFEGYLATITLFAPQDGRRKFKAMILGADENQVQIDQDGETFTLDIGNIAKARLVPDYDSIFAGKN